MTSNEYQEKSKPEKSGSIKVMTKKSSNPNKEPRSEESTSLSKESVNFKPKESEDKNHKIPPHLSNDGKNVGYLQSTSDKKNDSNKPQAKSSEVTPKNRGPKGSPQEIERIQISKTTSAQTTASKNSEKDSTVFPLESPKTIPEPKVVQRQNQTLRTENQGQGPTKNGTEKSVKDSQVDSNQPLETSSVSADQKNTRRRKTKETLGTESQGQCEAKNESGSSVKDSQVDSNQALETSSLLVYQKITSRRKTKETLGTESQGHHEAKNEPEWSVKDSQRAANETLTVTSDPKITRRPKTTQTLGTGHQGQREYETSRQNEKYESSKESDYSISSKKSDKPNSQKGGEGQTVKLNPKQVIESETDRISKEDTYFQHSDSSKRKISKPIALNEPSTSNPYTTPNENIGSGSSERSLEDPKPQLRPKTSRSSSRPLLSATGVTPPADKPRAILRDTTREFRIAMSIESRETREFGSVESLLPIANPDRSSKFDTLSKSQDSRRVNFDPVEHSRKIRFETHRRKEAENSGTAGSSLGQTSNVNPESNRRLPVDSRRASSPTSVTEESKKREKSG